MNPDTANGQTGEFVQAEKLETTQNTDIDNQDDPLQGKSTPEKIATEMLLNMGDSLEADVHCCMKMHN